MTYRLDICEFQGLGAPRLITPIHLAGDAKRNRRRAEAVAEVTRLRNPRCTVLLIETNNGNERIVSV